MMPTSNEIAGDQCIVLPKDFLQSVEAAVDIYEDELAQVAVDLDVESLRRAPGYFSGCGTAAALWWLPALWTVCY